MRSSDNDRSLDRNLFIRGTWLVALAFAAGYLVVFVAQLPSNIAALAWNSDYASGFTIAESVVRAGVGGHTVLASAGQWVLLWFGLATARLPLHRTLWGVAPTVLFIATGLIVGWSVDQVAGRRAAVLAVLMSVVVSPLALAFLMAAEAHNSVYPCTALLGAYLIWLSRGRGRRRALAFAVPPLAGVALGTCVASDLLVVATAVIPLGLTAILTGLRRDRRCRLIALSALTTVAVAIPVARLTSAVMHSLGFLTIATPVRLAGLSELPQRAELLFKGLKVLFNGYLGPAEPGTLHTPLGIASDVAMSGALLTLLVLGARATFTFLSTGLHRSSAGAQTPGQLARSLHVIYWTGSAACACGAFLLAAETGGGTALHESYYATVIFSVAAVIPLLLSAGQLVRRLVPAGVAVLFLAGLVGLTSKATGGPAIALSARGIERAADASGATVGYAGYWDASSLTWGTHGRVTARPVMACVNPSGASVCPFYEADVPAWYVPRRRRTFLLVDPGEPWVSSLPSGLGRPLALYTVGTISMYVYPYDIAGRLGPQL